MTMMSMVLDQKMLSYAQYNGSERLTIDIGFEAVKTTSGDNLTSLNEVSGFEGVIGSSKDDIIIGGNNENKIAGAAGEDLISGDNDDFVDYGREQAFAHQSQAFHLDKGIQANLQHWSMITDTYGYKDTLYRTNDGHLIKNIIGTTHDDNYNWFGLR